MGLEARSTQQPENDMAKPLTETSERQTNVDAMVNDIWLIHAAVDRLYGTGFAKDNPSVVANYMKAFALKQQADELAKLRALFASGSGGITVGIENEMARS